MILNTEKWQNKNFIHFAGAFIAAGSGAFYKLNVWYWPTDKLSVSVTQIKHNRTEQKQEKGKRNHIKYSWIEKKYWKKLHLFAY